MFFPPLILIFKIHYINVMISSLCYLLVSLLASLHLRELEGVLVPSLHTQGHQLNGIPAVAWVWVQFQEITILGTKQIDNFFFNIVHRLHKYIFRKHYNKLLLKTSFCTILWEAKIGLNYTQLIELHFEYVIERRKYTGEGKITMSNT